MKNIDFEHNKEAFKVPEGYFEQLEKNILAQTVETKEDAKIISINKNRKRFYLFSSVTGVAASLVLLWGIFLNSSDSALTENDIVVAENSIYTTLLGESDTFSEDSVLSYDTEYLFE